jgi:superfamily II DNA/RNA helicase
MELHSQASNNRDKCQQDDLENEFAESWAQPEQEQQVVSLSKVIAHDSQEGLDQQNVKPMSNLEILLKSNKISNDNQIENISEKDKLEKVGQIKRQGIEMLAEFKKRNIEISGIDENMIIKSWDDIEFLGVNKNNLYVKNLIKSIKKYGFELPRPIQCATIGKIAKNGDLITQAKAGNGKTAAYVIGSSLRIDPTLYKTQVLILSPTQLLADQIYDVSRNLTKFTGITSHCYHGGRPQPRDGRNPQIIVGCPGRINDLIKRGRIDLNNIKTVILDEGDELLKQGFREQVKSIIETLAETIQICIFSATLPNGILELCTRFMNNPAYVILPVNQVITELVTQWYIRCENMGEKNGCVLDIIESNKNDKIIIFFNSCNGLSDFSQILKDVNVNHLCIYSKMEPFDREQSINNFLGKDIDEKDTKNYNILLASDMVSRGLDFPCVTLVVNYDIPSTETYIHRIGRSGRGALLGNAITLTMTEEDRNKITYIVQVHGIPIKALKNIKMESKPNANPLSVAH